MSLRWNKEKQATYYQIHRLEIVARQREKYRLAREEIARIAGYASQADMLQAQRGDYMARLAQIPDLRRQGLTHVEIAARLGISHHTVARALLEDSSEKRNAGDCNTCATRRECIRSVMASGPLLRRECGGEPAMFWSTECADVPAEQQHVDRGFADEYAGPHGRLVASPKWGPR